MCNGKCCKQGTRGPRGLIGPRGPAYTLPISSVNQTLSQVISSGPTVVTDMIIPVVPGVYAGWFDGFMTGTGVGRYGFYLDDAELDFSKPLPGADGVFSCINGEIIVAVSGNVTVKVTPAVGSVTVTRASLILIKTQ